MGNRAEISRLLGDIFKQAARRGWELDDQGGYDGYIEVTPNWAMTLDDLDAILWALDMKITITTRSTEE